MKQRISRISLSLIWLSVPYCMYFQIADKYSIFVFILTAFMLFSHSCQAYIFNELLQEHNKVVSIILILIFGPIEIEKLQRNKNQHFNEIDTTALVETL